MKEHPMLYSTPMVQAIDEDRKTQTRRIITERNSLHTPPFSLLDFSDVYTNGRGLKVRHKEDETLWRVSPKWEVEDIIWVRETWREIPQDFGEPRYEYKAVEKINLNDKWKPSLFMPRAACRLLLEITDLKAERLQAISRADAIAEGVCISDPAKRFPGYREDRWPEENYATLWNNINTKPGTRWQDNPFVWVITFKKNKNEN